MVFKKIDNYYDVTHTFKENWWDDKDNEWYLYQINYLKQVIQDLEDKEEKGLSKKKQKKIEDLENDLYESTEHLEKVLEKSDILTTEHKNLLGQFKSLTLKLKKSEAEVAKLKSERAVQALETKRRIAWK